MLGSTKSYQILLNNAFQDHTFLFFPIYSKPNWILLELFILSILIRAWSFMMSSMAQPILHLFCPKEMKILNTLLLHLRMMRVRDVTAFHHAYGILQFLWKWPLFPKKDEISWFSSFQSISPLSPEFIFVVVVECFHFSSMAMTLTIILISNILLMLSCFQFWFR